MATFTIKIDSEDLARDVLSHFGCLDEDDVPDLISDEEEGEEEEDMSKCLMPSNATKCVHRALLCIASFLPTMLMFE